MLASVSIVDRVASQVEVDLLNCDPTALPVVKRKTGRASLARPVFFCLSSVLGRSLLSPVRSWRISPVIFPVISPVISIVSVIAARRVNLLVSFVVLVRFMVRVDTHPVAISRDESRRRVTLIAPLSAFEPIISSLVGIVINLVVGIVVVGPPAWSAGNEAAGSVQ